MIGLMGGEVVDRQTSYYRVFFVAGDLRALRVTSVTPNFRVLTWV